MGPLASLSFSRLEGAGQSPAGYAGFQGGAGAGSRQPPFASWSPSVGTGAPISRPPPCPHEMRVCALPGSPSLEDHEHPLPLPYTLPSLSLGSVSENGAPPANRPFGGGQHSPCPGVCRAMVILSRIRSVGQSVNKHVRSTPRLQAPALLCTRWHLSSRSPGASAQDQAPGTGLGTFRAGSEP